MQAVAKALQLDKYIAACFEGAGQQRFASPANYTRRELLLFFWRMTTSAQSQVYFCCDLSGESVSQSGSVVSVEGLLQWYKSGHCILLDRDLSVGRMKPKALGLALGITEQLVQK